MGSTQAEPSQTATRGLPISHPHFVPLCNTLHLESYRMSISHCNVASVPKTKKRKKKPWGVDPEPNPRHRAGHPEFRNAGGGSPRGGGGGGGPRGEPQGGRGGLLGRREVIWFVDMIRHMEVRGANPPPPPLFANNRGGVTKLKCEQASRHARRTT